MLIIRPLHYIIYYDNLLNMNKQGKITPLTISTPPPKKKKTGLLHNVAKAFIITLLENNHIKAQMIKKKLFYFFQLLSKHYHRYINCEMWKQMITVIKTKQYKTSWTCLQIPLVSNSTLNRLEKQMLVFQQHIK